MRLGWEHLSWHLYPGSGSQHMNNRSSIQEYANYQDQPVNVHQIGRHVIDYQNQATTGPETLYPSHLNRVPPSQDRRANDGEPSNGDRSQRHAMNQAGNNIPADGRVHLPEQISFAPNALEPHITAETDRRSDSAIPIASHSNIHQRSMSDVQRFHSSFAHEALACPHRATEGWRNAVNSEPGKFPISGADRTGIHPSRQLLLEDENHPDLEQYRDSNKVPVRSRQDVDTSKFIAEHSEQHPRFEESNIEPSRSNFAQAEKKERKRCKKDQKDRRKQEQIANLNNSIHSLCAPIEEQNKKAEIAKLKINNSAYQASIEFAMGNAGNRDQTESVSPKVDDSRIPSRRNVTIKQNRFESQGIIPFGQNPANSLKVGPQHERLRGESSERNSSSNLHQQQRSFHHTNNRSPPDKSEQLAEVRKAHSKELRSDSSTMSDSTSSEKHRSSEAQDPSCATTDGGKSNGESSGHEPEKSSRRRERSGRSSLSSNGSDRHRSKLHKACPNDEQPHRISSSKRQNANIGADPTNVAKEVIGDKLNIKREDEDYSVRLQDVPEPSTENQQDTPHRSTSTHIPITTTSENRARESSVKLEIIEKRVLEEIPEISTRAIPVANEEDPTLRNAPKGPRRDMNSNLTLPGQRQYSRNPSYHEGPFEHGG